MTSKLYTPRNYVRMYDHIRDNGTEFITQDGDKTREIINFHLRIANPRDRLVLSKGRKMSAAFAFAEALAYIYGYNELNYFTKFVPRMSKWSTDGEHLDGAYGPIIADTGEKHTQITGVIDMLKRDPETRRAVITVYQREHLFGAGGKNTPCTLSLQFLIRDNKLDMITTMRSNDFVWGFTNDLVAVTLIHELVARMVGIQLGTYYHNAASMHIYDHHLSDKYRELIVDEYRWPHVMGKMPAEEPYFNLYLVFSVYRELNRFVKLNELAENLFSNFDHSYWRDLCWVAFSYLTRDENPEDSKNSLKLIEDQTMRKAASLWVT